MAEQLAELNKGEGFKYSTTETFTGKYWIDGKPIYCRVIEDTTPSTAQVYSMGTIANLGEVITAHFVLYAGFYVDGAAYTGTAYTPFNYGYVLMNGTTGTVNYKSLVSNYFNKPIKAIIEYTKA